jgi:hypothetical protein
LPGPGADPNRSLRSGTFGRAIRRGYPRTVVQETETTRDGRTLTVEIARALGVEAPLLDGDSHLRLLKARVGEVHASLADRQ